MVIYKYTLEEEKIEDKILIKIFFIQKISSREAFGEKE